MIKYWASLLRPIHYKTEKHFVVYEKQEGGSGTGFPCKKKREKCQWYERISFDTNRIKKSLAFSPVGRQISQLRNNFIRIDRCCTATFHTCSIDISQYFNNTRIFDQDGFSLWEKPKKGKVHRDLVVISVEKCGEIFFV